jgi:hypothetical protein
LLLPDQGADPSYSPNRNYVTFSTPSNQAASLLNASACKGVNAGRNVPEKPERASGVCPQ